MLRSGQRVSVSRILASSPLRHLSGTSLGTPSFGDDPLIACFSRRGHFKRSSPNDPCRRNRPLSRAPASDGNQSRGDFLLAMLSLHLNVDLERALCPLLVGWGGPSLSHTARSIPPSYV